MPIDTKKNYCTIGTSKIYPFSKSVNQLMSSQFELNSLEDSGPVKPSRAQQPLVYWTSSETEYFKSPSPSSVLAGRSNRASNSMTNGTSPVTALNIHRFVLIIVPPTWGASKQPLSLVSVSTSPKQLFYRLLLRDVMEMKCGLSSQTKAIIQTTKGLIEESIDF